MTYTAQEIAEADQEWASIDSTVDKMVAWMREQDGDRVKRLDWEFVLLMRELPATEYACNLAAVLAVAIERLATKENGR